MSENSEIPRSNSVLPGNKEFSTVSSLERELASQEKIADFASSNNSFEKSFILPREAWISRLAFLREILKAKQALDRIKE